MSKTIEQELASLADSILTQMRQGADQWYMPWHQGLEEPINLVTGRVFSGRNAAILWSQCQKRGYKRNQWATLKQWSKRRAKVRRGAKGVRVFVPKFNLGPDFWGGDSSEMSGFRSYHVFNVAELNNFNPDHPDLFDTFDVNHNIENLARKCRATIKFGGDRACYIPSLDRIEMPPQNRFYSTPHTTAEEGYYSTLAHELVHWTRPAVRANRPVQFEDDSLDYAFEELVAELGAAIICSRFGQNIEPRPDHAAYLKSWLSVLEDDFQYFYKALAIAQDAVHWLYEAADMLPREWALNYSGQEVVSQQRPPVAAAAYTVENPSGRKFNRNLAVAVSCGNCHEEYRVVLTRGESSSACPHCMRFNEHAVEW